MNVAEYNKKQCENCSIPLVIKCRRDVVRKRFCSRYCRAIFNRPNQKMANTGIELKIKGFLENQNIKFEPQPNIDGIVNADFLVYPNIVIFADGDYWHNLPKAIKRDKFVNEQLHKNNYITLRFKEKDINNNFEFVKHEILKESNASTIGTPT